MIRTQHRRFPLRSLLLLAISAGLAVSGAGCMNLGSGGGDTSDDGDNVLLSETLSNDGTMSGKVVDTQSTRNSLVDTSTAQTLPVDFDTSDTEVRFNDIVGNQLLDENGNPIDPVQLNPDGSFEADHLPVGVDFTVCADIGRDGNCDVESCVNIPSSLDGGPNELYDVQADPLTTLVLAKLREMMMEKGIDPADLPISPVAVATRIVDAYIHLFEESGIDQEVVLADIETAAQKLAELFDTLIPAGARAGMDLVDGNLDLALATDVEGRALSIAKVFLRAGFPIADGPDRPDLSALADLEGVEVLGLDELLAEGDHFTDEFTDQDKNLDEFLDEQHIEPAEFGSDGFFDVFVYVNTLAEPDRNNGETGDGELEGDMPKPNAPILHDYLIREMAVLKAERRKITIGDLYDLLTDIDDGLGARLSYFLFDPNFIGPPLNVFETSNGEGKAINLERFFNRIFSGGFDDLGPEQFKAREAELRQLLKDLLTGTIPPAFGRLFDAIVSDRIGSAPELADIIRNAKAHLPFSRSGPSEFFVVADGDQFRGDTGVSAVSVDVDLTVDGDVLGISFNETGSGRYWLGFTHGTEENGAVELLVRETGRFLHGHRGPIRLNMNNGDLFEPVNGLPFIDFVSETANFFPGIHVSVIRDDFIPEPVGPERLFEDLGIFDGPDDFQHDGLDDDFHGDGITEPVDDGQNTDGIVTDLDDRTVDDGTVTDDGTPADDGSDTPSDVIVEEPAAQEFTPSGPNQQLFVLATNVGIGAEPVRVNYDPNSGLATYNPGGRHLLMFMPDSDQTGLFALFNEQTGRPAGLDDPNQFFEGPIDQPERFEEFFNNFDDFEHFDEFDDLGGFVDDFIEDIPFDEFFFPPDDEFFPEDGEFLPPEDGHDPLDGMQDPIDDGQLPPLDDPNLQDGQDPNDPVDPPPADDPNAPADDGNLLSPAELGDDGTVVDDPIDPIVEETGDPIDEVFDDGIPDGSFDDDIFTGPEHGEFGDGFEILVSVEDIVGLPLSTELFTHVFGTNVQNMRYDPSGDPYYDDVNGDGVEQLDEPTAQHRPTLFDPNDWRSTDIRMYYRRADNNEAVTFDQVNFESPTPQTMDGVALVPRNYRPRLNAFRFSRPNTAINLLTAFLPPEFFDGTQSFNRETKVDVLTAVALINLVMDQVFNIEANIDFDGIGPLPRQTMLIDAHLFVAPVGDPFVMLLEGFSNRSVPEPGVN